MPSVSRYTVGIKCVCSLRFDRFHEKLSCILGSLYLALRNPVNVLINSFELKNGKQAKLKWRFSNGHLWPFRGILLLDVSPGKECKSFGELRSHLAQCPSEGEDSETQRSSSRHSERGDLILCIVAWPLQ